MKTSWARVDAPAKRWLLVDAEGQILGRFASKIATVLMGKNKPIYTPFIDTGDFIVVINAEKISVTGKKMKDKVYNRHSGYLGGLKTRSLNEYLVKKPEDIIYLATRRMLPKNKIGRQMLKKLKVYAGPNHPHSAQQLEKFEI